MEVKISRYICGFNVEMVVATDNIDDLSESLLKLDDEFRAVEEKMEKEHRLKHAERQLKEAAHVIANVDSPPGTACKPFPY